MKKLLLVLMILSFCFFGASVVNAATAPNGKTAPTVSYSDVSSYNSSYYSSVSGKKGDELLEGLASLSKTKHRTFTKYDDLWGAACYADADPSNKSSKIIDFYTQKSISNAYKTSVWNREHVWCQSLTNGLYGTDGAGADIHHIRPSIDNINSSRNNSLYGEVSSSKPKYYSFTNDKVSTSSSDTLYGYLDSSLHANGVFEPLDNVKGDVARIVMYVYMHYSKDISANSSFTYAGTMKITNIVYTSEKTDQAAFDLLVEWNEQDPVSSNEQDRNDYCASVTGLRNPFIDHPEFAGMIWNESYSGGGAMDDNDSSQPTVDYQALLSEYQNNGVYTKKSNIYLNEGSSYDISNYFHGDIAQDRTTYYNGDYLLMCDIDGNFDKINSGYRTNGNAVSHYIYQNGQVVDDYTVENTTLHTMYVTMNKFKSNYLDETWSDGVHSVTSKTDKYLADFLAFTAPCLTDYVLTSNYLSSIGMTLEIAEEHNSIGDYLALRIYVDSLDSGKVFSDLILSEARIYKGNSKFNDTDLTSTPVVPDDGGNTGGGSSSGGSTGGGTITTPVKTTYSYTFTKKVYSSESTVALGNKNWRLSGTNGMYLSYNSSKGHQFGSEANPAYSLNLTSTTDFDQVTSVYITTCGASGTKATLKMYVGGVEYGTRTLTETSSTYRITPGGASGRVSFKFTQSTASGVAKAIYIKEIKVYYTSGYTTSYTADDFELSELSDDYKLINIYTQTDLLTSYTPEYKSYI